MRFPAFQRLSPLMRAGLPASLILLLGGCSWDLLDPAGSVGIQNRDTILWATGLMLLVVIPVIAMTLAFAWRYRASNLTADYAPEWSHSNRIEVVIWVVPTIIVAALAAIAWKTTHELDPYRPLPVAGKPIEVQVVALDWKWLFIYPEFGVASVNQLAMPVGRPVNFRITSASVMNSFFIPKLGSQVYAMAGMQTKLHLIADKPGSYEGISANFSGDGFSDMRFKAVALDEKGFQNWIAKAKASQETLNTQRYRGLYRPSEREPVAYFGKVDPALYDAILMQQTGPSREDKTIVPGDFQHTPTHAATNQKVMNHTAMNMPPMTAPMHAHQD